MALSLPGAALAQSAAPDGPPGLVAVVLRADEPDLRVELSPGDPGLLTDCFAPCRVFVRPGWYQLRVSGHDPDIEGDFSWLSVEHDVDVDVRAPWESRKKRGKWMGITGVGVFAGGLSVTLLGYLTMLAEPVGSFDLDLYGDEEDGESGPTEDEPDQEAWDSPLVPIGLGVAAFGGALAAVGWRSYARNTGPGLRSVPSARARAPTGKSWIVTPAPIGQGFGVVAGARF
ncbi:MAG: hypothetical protein JW751_08885 [Polyangiaceae bacterium]|nr:hypothetical protein [Polyangiaceae bacterium]